MTDLVVVGVGFAALWAVERHVMRGEVEKLGKRISAVHTEVASWRACHDQTVQELDRRLSGLEEVMALAANEVRIASNQLMARLPDPEPGPAYRGERE